MGEQIAHHFCGQRRIIFIDDSEVTATIKQVVIVNNNLVALVDEDGSIYNWDKIAVMIKTTQITND